MDRDLFERVWKRVQEGKAASTALGPCNDRERMERLIAGESRGASRYGWLRGHGSGRCRAEAERGEREAQRRLNRLQAEYFLRYGDSYIPGREKREEGPGVLSTLRLAYQGEQVGAAAFREAAAAAAEQELSGLYTSLAAEKERRAAALRQLIAAAMR